MQIYLREIRALKTHFPKGSMGKQIFRDGWEAFKARYARYQEVDEVVRRMLGCGEYENGHAVYICLECLDENQVISVSFLKAQSNIAPASNNNLRNC